MAFAFSTTSSKLNSGLDSFHPLAWSSIDLYANHFIDGNWVDSLSMNPCKFHARFLSFTPLSQFWSCTSSSQCSLPTWRTLFFHSNGFHRRHSSDTLMHWLATHRSWPGFLGLLGLILSSFRSCASSLVWFLRSDSRVYRNHLVGFPSWPSVPKMVTTDVTFRTVWSSILRTSVCFLSLKTSFLAYVIFTRSVAKRNLTSLNLSNSGSTQLVKVLRICSG